VVLKNLKQMRVDNLGLCMAVIFNWGVKTA